MANYWATTHASIGPKYVRVDSLDPPSAHKKIKRTHDTKVFEPPSGGWSWSGPGSPATENADDATLEP